MTLITTVNIYKETLRTNTMVLVLKAMNFYHSTTEVNLCSVYLSIKKGFPATAGVQQWLTAKS